MLQHGLQLEAGLALFGGVMAAVLSGSFRVCFGISSTCGYKAKCGSCLRQQEGTSVALAAT